VVAIGFGCTVALLGCDDQPSEAERMLARLERMRTADASERLGMLEELERTTTADPVAENARATCTRAYRALHRGMATLSRAAQATSTAPTRARAQLQQADSHLDDADLALGQCSDAMVALRMHTHSSDK